MNDNLNHTKLDERPLGFITRVAYGCGDTACNVVYGMVGTILTLFYTDYIGIPAAAIAVIMLISRVFDGVSDFIMGFIVERTHTKWGQSRPWVLWMAVPYAISGVLMFAVPHTTQNLQFIYIFITYNLCTTVIYTALNLPYGSLSAMMTRSSHERDMLSVFRMALWCVIALALLLFCFARCKETVVIPAREQSDQRSKTPIGKSIRAIACNPYFWACLVVWMCMTSYTTVIGTVLPYYCKYILGNDTYIYSALYVSETAVTIICTFACALLVKRFGKRNLILAGILLAFAAQIIFCFASKNFTVLMFTTVIRGIGVSPLFALLFGMVGDAVEYGQWKTHLRQESLMFSAGSVGNKIGIGIVSAVTTGLLSYSGYISSTNDASVVQPDSALQMITNLLKFAPMILFAGVLIVMLLYKLDKRYPAIMEELREREKRGEL